ncbi:MAG: phosphatidate cytidylyltransferase [Pseudomonadales bacterium]
MLRARILTALILAPLVVSALYFLPLPAYALFFWLFAAAAAYEWAGLARIGSTLGRVAYLTALAVLALVTWQLPEYWVMVLWLAAIFWLLAAAAVVAYPRSGPIVSHPLVIIPAGLLVTWAAWLAFVVVRDQPGGATWVLWLLLLVWSADIGAYFAGRRFGRRKLAPRVSPGKTWEGFAGGMLASLVVTLAMLVPMGAVAWWWVPVVVLLAVLSVFGDLFESVLKRQRGVKDSGTLLPGHGGVLDRIDSLVAVLPVFALVLADRVT